ncbi:glycosyltransferase family 39 protein [Echinicola jeungdonensis]|uniref:ArnT family glycosyltransferase n=1 Tax=Echinicola jeungdonensis TaxID=709343 RepID=A0ABV5J4T4_9BACT|nr:glycosyltransferase family 39 protein [Echinicola jeungdonensis]MDN3668831.1 glycosyltransferase family 39 protein [Echinicola jeungdonensis]
MKGTFSSIGMQTSPWLVILAFTFLVAPFALDFHLHYPDEMYYSNAAIKMMQNNDYLTTYLGSGELRFKKPILTYWGVLAGFKIFGPSAFSSRIFFLLAGSALVFMVFKIGKLATGNKKTAYISAWIAATHPVVIFSSTRSIPDILLTLFMTMTAWGISGMIKYGNDSPKRYIWLTYLGIGLGFEAKGLPAAALGAIGIGYLMWNPWKKIHWKKILNLPAILICVGIGLFWFIAMYLKFDTTYLDSFFADQVGIRVGSKIAVFSKNLLLAISLMVLLFIPWVFFGFPTIKKHFKPFWHENKPFIGFVITWTIAIILMSALVFKFYERYLLPVVPLSAVGLAMLLEKENSSRLNKFYRWGMIFFLAINFILLVVACYLNLGIGAPYWIYFGLILGLMVFILLGNQLAKKQQNVTTLGLSILMVFYWGALVTYQISIPNQGAQLSNFVEENDIPEGSKIGFIGHIRTGSKIRIGLGEDYFMTDLPDQVPANKLADFQYLICDEAGLEQIPQSKFKIQTAAINWDPDHIPSLLKSIYQGKSDQLFQKIGKRYFWAEKLP